MSAERDVIDAAIAFVAEVDVPAGGADYSERSRARAKLIGAVRNLEEARRRREVVGTWEAEPPHPYPCRRGSTLLGPAEPCTCNATRDAQLARAGFGPLPPGPKDSTFIVTAEQIAAAGNREVGVVIDSIVHRLGSLSSRLREGAALGKLSREDAQQAWEEALGIYGLESRPLFDQEPKMRGQQVTGIIIDEAQVKIPCAERGFRGGLVCSLPEHGDDVEHKWVVS